MSTGRKASAHWLHSTSTSPTRSMTPRAVIDAAPAISILSKMVAV
jgi:hypothetical protein